MPTVNRRVRFYEVRSESGDRLQEITDLETHFFNVVASLPAAATEHYVGESGTRLRGTVHRSQEGATGRSDLVILDRVHREPPFRYVRQGSYTDHNFGDADTEFAEPKFLAFFPRNVVATFTSGIRTNTVEAALSTWRIHEGLGPITLEPITDVDRLAHLRDAGLVGRLDVSLPAEVARAIYGQGGPASASRTSLAEFFRRRSERQVDGLISVGLTFTDAATQGELREELGFLVQDDESYRMIADAEGSQVNATYYRPDGTGRRAINFLGQELAMSIGVDIENPEAGPQPHIASEALFRAHDRKRDALHLVLGQG